MYFATLKVVKNIKIMMSGQKNKTSYFKMRTIVMMDITRNVPYRIIKILLDNPINLILNKVLMK